ncbi:hypothetical protein [Aeromonas hydrophila]|uniref:hypothetical protein n=1 Tax=Aeromonas hydrophila TaxID=644 RepID=UPI001CCC080E|nr:hypothetical protein [Aeromonas hydrophila]UBQ52811.1 hypothetical protein LCH17_22480 [Aeromonas hydrophila]
MAIERQDNQVHQIHTAGDQLASARHRGGDHLQLLDRSLGPAAGAHQTIQITACPSTVATGTAGRLYHAQGNQVHRIHTAGDQLASPRH